jgi:peptide chain release factor-like protein
MSTAFEMICWQWKVAAAHALFTTPFQKVNKTSNCVFLKHMPTGTIVKCHATRYQERNRRIGLGILRDKLDRAVNGDRSRIGLKV